jgi:hypothetical protein
MTMADSSTDASRLGPKKGGVRVVDDHPIVRPGLRELVADEPDRT